MEPQSQTGQQRHGPQPRRHGLPHGLHTVAPALPVRPRQVTARAEPRHLAAATRSILRGRVLRARRQEVCLMHRQGAPFALLLPGGPYVRHVSPQHDSYQ